MEVVQMSEFKAQREVLLRQLTSLGVGGRPILYARPQTCTELAAALSHCLERGLAFRIMGAGSNLLVDEGPLPFAVIHICSPGLDWIRRTGPASVSAGAGVRLGRLLAYCRRKGLGGLEFLAGVPGTLGGALAGNAGAWGGSIGERLARLWVLDEAGREVERPASRIRFAYRTSTLGGRVITGAELALEPREPRRIGCRMARFIAEKSKRHPTETPSAGCVFKNPHGASAGRLLDLCGMKGKRVGGAEVSRLHANFICNVAEASSSDVLRLIELMRTAVFRNFSVELELEIKRWSSRQKAA